MPPIHGALSIIWLSLLAVHPGPHHDSRKDSQLFDM